MTKAGIPRAKALPLAERIVERLEPGCNRLQIAGSLRRGNATVGDIEIVAIPKVGPRADLGLFAPPASLLDPILADLVERGKLFPNKQGPRYKQYQVRIARPVVLLDLFLTTPDAWGYVLAIRTGPWDYSRHIVTQRYKGGALDDDHVCADGRVWRYDDSARGEPGIDWTTVEDHRVAAVSVPEEADFFSLIRGGYVPPEKRRHR